jgi:hypothetical protein
VDDLPEESFWDWTRRRRKDAAFIRFLGLPVFMFDKLCELCRPHVPAYLDPDVPRHGGPTPRFDYIDAVAMALRRLQIDCIKQQEVLQIEFCGGSTTVSRTLSVIRPILAGVAETWHDARVEYPSLAEAKTALEGVYAQHGQPPWPHNLILALMLDGTDTPAKKASNDHLQRLQKGSKGHSWIHQLMFSFSGLVCDYSIGNLGTINDIRCARNMLDRHQFNNPDGLALLVDNGYNGACTDWPSVASGAMAAVLRPLRSENVPFALLAYAERCSAYITVLRQANEMLNGNMKRSFPGMCRAFGVDEHDDLVMDLLTIIHLFNARTRLVGYNQVRTTYLRHADANFRRRLEHSDGFEGFVRMAAEDFAMREVYGDD